MVTGWEEAGPSRDMFMVGEGKLTKEGVMETEEWEGAEVEWTGSVGLAGWRPLEVGKRLTLEVRP
jgi:hypothetical protein